MTGGSAGGGSSSFGPTPHCRPFAAQSLSEARSLILAASQASLVPPHAGCWMLPISKQNFVAAESWCHGSFEATNA